MIDGLRSASDYVDRQSTDGGRTYGGLLKLGVCSAVALPVTTLSGGAVPYVHAALGIHVLLYGNEGAAKLLDKLPFNRSGQQAQPTGP